MKFADWIRKHQTAATIGAIIILLAAVGVVIARRSRGGPGVMILGGKGYFYDLGNGQLFAEDGTRQVPFPAPSGSGEAVRALVNACGDCAVESQRKIGHLSKLTDAMQQKLKSSGHKMTAELMTEINTTGTMVALPPPSDSKAAPSWIAMDHPQAMQVVERHLSACGGNGAQICKP